MRERIVTVIDMIVEVLMSKRIKISPNTKINKLTILSYDYLRIS